MSQEVGCLAGPKKLVTKKKERGSKNLNALKTAVKSKQEKGDCWDI